MARTSCIEHPARMALAILREDYLGVCDGDHAAALLLSALEHWTNVRRARSELVERENDALVKEGLEPHPPEGEVWIYNTYAGWMKDCLGILKEHDVKRGLALLESKGFVAKRRNPVLKWDRTLQYRLEVEAVNRALHPVPVPDAGAWAPVQSAMGEPTIPETCTETCTENAASPVFSEPVAEERRPDMFDLAARTLKATKGKASSTVTADAGGADPWQDGPLDAVCKLFGIQEVPPKMRRDWARQVERVAGQWGATPEQVAQAVGMIRDSEHGWRTFATPHDRQFQAVLGVMVDRVVSGVAGQGSAPGGLEHGEVFNDEATGRLMVRMPSGQVRDAVAGVDFTQAPGWTLPDWAQI